MVFDETTAPTNDDAYMALTASDHAMLDALDVTPLPARRRAKQIVQVKKKPASPSSGIGSAAERKRIHSAAYHGAEADAKRRGSSLAEAKQAGRAAAKIRMAAYDQEQKKRGK